MTMNEADISIDIHTLKLNDWLISRRICPKNIQIEIKDIRKKITNALKDMPSNHELIELLSGSQINYYHCKEIIEILKQTEKNTKSVFGTYGSKRMKEWQEIVRLYEKNNIYLAETAQIFIRNVSFEIPGVRKQMNKLEQQTDECVKRIQELSKPESQFQAEYENFLKKLGIKGQNLAEELMEVLKKLPFLYANSIRNIGKLEVAIQWYADFRGLNTNLPITRHIIKFGNSTVYQYVNNEAPLSIEEPPIKLNFTVIDNQTKNSNEIDFDIDSGGTLSTISAETIDISNFKIEDISTASDLSEGVTIDWDLKTTEQADMDNNIDISLEEYDIVIEDSGKDEGVAKGDQALSLLDSVHYRDRFIDELTELESFLKMRLFELNQLDAGSNIMFSFMENISTYDGESLQKFLNMTVEILEELHSEHSCHLFQLKHSPKYADLLANKLKKMKNAVNNIRAKKESFETQSVKLRQQRVQLNPVLDKIIRETKCLQKQIEEEISKRYKNRVVNMIGVVY